MTELVATAERLRVVKDACLDFMTLWALDQLMAETHSCDRIHRDVLEAPQCTENSSFGILYSGRGLDD